MTARRESVLGPSYWYHRRLTERSKSWSAHEISEYQALRFRRLTRRYGDAVTQKDDYRTNLRKYSRFDAPLLTHAVRTSGTSGQPLRFTADTFSRRQKERAYLFDIWAQVGYAPHDVSVACRGDVHDGLVRYNRFENLWIISPSATMERDGDSLRRWVKAVPPFFLHVHASGITVFKSPTGMATANMPSSLTTAGSAAGSTST